VLGGVGVHSGLRCAARVLPAPWGTGRVFVCRGEHIPADLAHARAIPGATVLHGEVAVAGTPEHLLSALSALGITDALVEVQGPEVPILDGSAAPWCEGLADVGHVEGPELRPRVVTEVVEVRAHGGMATLRPADRCEVAVEVDFGGPWCGRAEVALERFCEEVAWARTFVFQRDVERLRAAGRGRGATPDNTVLLGEHQALAPLRAPDEPVRHKLLDAVGDLALVGPVLGRLEVKRGSHALHLAILRSWEATGGAPAG